MHTHKHVCTHVTCVHPDMGRKLQPWLESPFNILSFGPRAGMGALFSLPERLQTL